jgi:acetylornithine deacetylase
MGTPVMGITAGAIRDAVRKRRDEIIEWARALVRFPSENRPPRGSEGEAQAFMAEELGKLGLTVDAFRPDEIPGIERHPSWLPGRLYGEGRKNVVGVWKGSAQGRGASSSDAGGPGGAPAGRARSGGGVAGGRSLLLSGHIDVAPFEPDNWSVCRPFEPVIRDGKLYGRGAADLKGGLAAAYWGIRILRELGFEPAGDVILESVVDEEFAGGNGALASRLRGHNADLAVLTEPTRMEVCPASLGALLGDLTLTGRAGMPYLGHDIPNPIKGAARAVECFSEWEAEWRGRNGHRLFEGPGKQLNVVLWCVDTRGPGEFTQMGIPLLTRISWIVWCYPGMTEGEFFRQFKAFWGRRSAEDPALAPFGLEVRSTFHFVRPWETDPASPAVRAVVSAFEAFTGSLPAVGGAPFSCDLSHYGDAGKMPAVILGPRGENLHAPDEWVLVEDVLTLTGVFALLAAAWCG